jgi:hypothetical protein
MADFRFQQGSYILDGSHGSYVVWGERKASSSDSNVTDETRARQKMAQIWLVRRLATSTSETC